MQVTRAGTRFYYRADGLGSIVAHEEHSSGFVQRFSYGPFGESATLAGHPFRYTARRADEETGLYYYRARMYSPALGRFLQTDPIGYQGGLNLYAYVGNDPVNVTDPLGLTSLLEYAKQGIRVMNAAIQGTHPVTGISFKQGFPDFSSVAIHTVQPVGLTGVRNTDNALANATAGLKATPDGYVWHHHQDGKTMQLVPESIHQATGHTGGSAYLKALGNLAKDIATDPTTYLSAGIGMFLAVMAPTPTAAGALYGPGTPYPTYEDYLARPSSTSDPHTSNWTNVRFAEQHGGK